MANISLTTHFTITIPASNGLDATTITGGSTTAPSTTLEGTYYYDQRFTVGATTLQELWSDSNALSDFDFLWIETNGDKIEVQLMCNEGGTLDGNNIENAFVVKLTAGIPFILSNDDSRNMGNMDGTFGESQHQDEIDNWETHWIGDRIDRIECYNTSLGAAADVRIVAVT